MVALWTYDDLVEAADQNEWYEPFICTEHWCEQTEVDDCDDMRQEMAVHATGFTPWSDPELMP